MPTFAAVAGLWHDYAGAVLLALVVHVVAGLALLTGWQAPVMSRELIRPLVIPATLVQLQAETKAPPAKPAPAKAPPAKTAPKPEPEPAATAKAAEPPATPAPKPEPVAKAKPEPEPVPAAEPEPQGPTAAQQALAQEGFMSSLEAEANLLSQQADNAVAASHAGAISKRVQQFWSRPPSARNGMEAELVIELVPTGDVVSVSVVRGSGNTAFDRSAELAVRRAARFEVPPDPVLFERYFRRFRLLFRPEDLMR